MPGQDRCKTLPEAQRGEIGASQNLGDGDAGAKPDKAGLESCHVKAAGCAAVLFLFVHVLIPHFIPGYGRLSCRYR